MDSASLLKQYRSMLTCFYVEASLTPDATWNCSKRHCQHSQSSEVLKLKGSEGWRQISAMSLLLLPCNINTTCSDVQILCINYILVTIRVHVA